MKIGLISAPMRDNDLEAQRKEIEKWSDAASADHELLCFGESFLQGFEGLTWDYETDRQRALMADSAPIQRLSRLAERHACGLAFGFIERDSDTLYSSYMVINKRGQIVDLFRRVSQGWKAPHASGHYREGNGFHTFRINGNTFASALCGDLWDETHVRALNKLQFDALLWAVYIDFSVEDWQQRELAAYAAQSAHVQKPVLMVNSWVDDASRANGGSYVFEDGKVVKELPMGMPGLLSYELA